jgi:hypothetical protein
VKILFDHGTPVPLRAALRGHDVSTAFEHGWQRLKNGDLLSAAEAAGFEVFITTDQNLGHQQNLSGRRLAVLVLPFANWPRLRPHAQLIADSAVALSPGACVELSIPTS